VKKTLKLQLIFTDRLGIILDVAKLMTGQGFNILAMELEQYDGLAEINIAIEQQDTVLDRRALLALCNTLPGIVSMRELQLLPRQKRQAWFRTLLDGMSEGIISVDRQGVINTINNVACRILDLSYENVIGLHVKEISPKDSILMDCLSKRIPVSRRKLAITRTGRIEFYGSAKPIHDTRGRFVGAVLLMKNLKEVKELVDAVSTPIEVTFDDFLGKSSAVKNLITFAIKIAETSSAVSIAGESGTGKELIARAIHYESGRKGPFVPVNCAALPEQLIESELFGYEDGAFTGAKKTGKPGLFEAASDGTIFLDEIGDMPPGLQAKLLRVLEDGCVRRIGGFEEIPVNARVISATNRDLRELVAQKKFRGDLFYRINVLNIQIPPLVERLMDIPLLGQHFLHQIDQRLGKSGQVISEASLQKLLQYNWPGNVRELKNVIERAAVLSESEEIREDVILLGGETITDRDKPGGFSRKAEGKLSSLRELVADFESEILQATLKSSPSIRQAASKLGISHSGLLQKMKKHEIIHGNRTNRR